MIFAKTRRTERHDFQCQGHTVLGPYCPRGTSRPRTWSVVVIYVFGAVDKTSSSFSVHSKIGNFIIIIIQHHEMGSVMLITDAHITSKHLRAVPSSVALQSLALRTH